MHWLKDKPSSQTALVYILALPLNGCVTLDLTGSLLNFFWVVYQPHKVDRKIQ